MLVGASAIHRFFGTVEILCMYMEERVRKFTLVATITAVAAVVFVGTVVRAVWYSPEAEFQLSLPEPNYAGASVALPERIEIPSLEVDTIVEKVGINTKGNMAAPSNYSDVGWYKYGTRPGEKGSAVIAGHFDNGFAQDGVFKHLEELHIGDDIIVKTEEGETLRFVVSATSSYPYTEVPAEELFNRNDTSRLNLITCSGDWIKSAKTYDRRLIVHAVFKEKILQ